MANANKLIQSVIIDECFYKEADKEEIEELLVVAINKAMQQADNISQNEMALMTKNMLGSMSGLFEK